MASSYDVINLSELAVPDAIVVPDAATIFSRWLARLRALDPTFDALVESDPTYKQGEVNAYQLRRSLSAVSLPTSVVEWWEETPRREPYTFRIEVYSQQEIDAALYSRIRRQVDKAKNLRSWLSRIDVIADLGSNGNFYAGGAVTSYIDIVIEVKTENV